jgi:PBP1b-binding outer membrane lipoprotein LpoB
MNLTIKKYKEIFLVRLLLKGCGEQSPLKNLEESPANHTESSVD